MITKIFCIHELTKNSYQWGCARGAPLLSVIDDSDVDDNSEDDNNYGDGGD